MMKNLPKINPMNLLMDHNIRAGIVGGTFLSSIVNIGVEDVLTTTILAVIGCIVSFIISYLLIFFMEKFKNKKNGQ